MPTLEQLKNIDLFRVLTDGMLEETLPLIEEQHFGEGLAIFEEGDPAVNLYLLIKGKVLLNMTASEDVCFSVMSTEPGSCFGWTALFGGGLYTAAAVCAEPVHIWTLKGKEFRKLLDKDHTMGFLVMDYAAREMNKRLEKRTSQLFKTLTKHIDLVCGLK